MTCIRIYIGDTYIANSMGPISCGEIGRRLAWHATTILAKLSQADLILSMGDSVLQPSTVVRNLGVYIDEHLPPPWKPMLVTVPRHASSTCDGSIICAVMLSMTGAVSISDGLSHTRENNNFFVITGSVARTAGMLIYV